MRSQKFVLTLSFNRNPFLTRLSLLSQQLLRDEITPKLDKHREEKRVYLEFQKKSSELEKLSKLVVAWDWTQLELKKAKGGDAVKESEVSKVKAIADKKKREDEIKVMEKEVGDIERRREKVCYSDFVSAVR